MAHSLSQTLCPTAGLHCSTFTEGTHGPHCGNIRMAPMALIAALSTGHPWSSLWQYPEGTHGPHCSNIWRAPMALIAAISKGHPWPSLWQSPEGTHGPHCCHIQRAPTSPHSCNIQRALPVSIPLRLQPALTSYPILLR